MTWLGRSGAALYLQGWEEAGHDQGALVEAKARPHIASHSEVGVLVNGTGYETAYVFAVAKDVGKRGGERWRCLRGWERNLADVVLALQAKNCADGIEGDTPGADIQK